MTACIIIGLIVSCTVTDPRPSPAEAAAKMTQPFAYVAPDNEIVPGVYVLHSRPQDGPYGPLRMQLPRRRLDGMPSVLPMQTYGTTPFWSAPYDSWSNTLRPIERRRERHR